MLIKKADIEMSGLKGGNEKKAIVPSAREIRDFAWSLSPREVNLSVMGGFSPKEVSFSSDMIRFLAKQAPELREAMAPLYSNPVALDSELERILYEDPLKIFRRNRSLSYPTTYANIIRVGKALSDYVASENRLRMEPPLETVDNIKPKPKSSPGPKSNWKLYAGLGGGLAGLAGLGALGTYLYNKEER